MSNNIMIINSYNNEEYDLPESSYVNGLQTYVDERA